MALGATTVDNRILNSLSVLNEVDALIAKMSIPAKQAETTNLFGENLFNLDKLNDFKSLFAPEKEFTETLGTDFLSFGQNGLGVNLNQFENTALIKEQELMEKYAESTWRFALFDCNLTDKKAEKEPDKK